MMRFACAIGLFLAGLLMPAAASAAGRQTADTFRLGTIRAPAGSVTAGRLDVPSGPDAATFIPVSVAHGTRPGPVLALIAGIHGSETTPILSLQRLVARLDASRLAGTVVLVHVANIPSFLGRTIYVGPVDGKNLNRQFPGRPDGTVSERIAHVLTTEVMTRADVVVDIHSGDANEDLTPWTGFYARHGAPDVVRQSRLLAMAFGLPYIVEFPFAPSAPGEAIYTGAAAVQLGKPSFDVEVGRLGLVEPGAIDTVVSGLESVMRHLKMLDGEPAAAGRPWFITRRDSLAAAHDGILYPLVKAGAYVTAGQRVAYITDFHGRRMQDLAAAEAGVVLSMVTTPAIRKDETVAVIAVPPTSR